MQISDDYSGMTGCRGCGCRLFPGPWAMLDDWNVLWSGWSSLWRHWLESMAAKPAVWMPALAAERQGEPDAIAFFLPWLPRIKAQISPPDHTDGDAMRVMLRATLPSGLDMAADKPISA